jgi:hypothetical protein
MKSGGHAYSIGRGRDRARLLLGVLPVHNAELGGNQVDGEDVVRVGEETNTSYNTSPDVVPAERSLVDLCKGKTTSLIGVGDMGIAGQVRRGPGETWGDRERVTRTRCGSCGKRRFHPLFWRPWLSVAKATCSGSCGG